VARNPAGKRELLEQLPKTRLVPRNFRVDLRVGAFEVDVRDERRPSVARAGNVDHVDVVLANDAVQMDVDEVLSGCGAPVPQKAWLDVFRLERLAQQRIVEKIDLADGQVVGGAPIGIHLRE
jgi:hypothetical protein